MSTAEDHLSERAGGSSSSDPLSSHPSDLSLSSAHSFHELNFFPLASQSNTYSLVSINVGGVNKLLVATVSGEIYRLELDQKTLKSSWKQITFSYIPAGVEIISLDAFVIDPNGVVVGVTLIKPSKPKDVYFNVYGLHCDPNSSLNWEQIAEDWTAVSLQFIPYKLLHTEIYNKDSWDFVFLLPGNNLNVHIYTKQVLEDSLLRFPEFKDLKSNITDVVMDTNKLEFKRITAFGCQNGYIRCSFVDALNNTLLKFVDTNILDGPMTSVNLLSSSFENLHLVATSAIQPAVVYKNVFGGETMDDYIILDHSDKFDSIICSSLGDITCNGYKELVIGTYGKMILVYGFQNQKDLPQAELLWKKGLAHPVLSVTMCDVTGDGLDEIIILSTAGVHILQHDLDQVCTLFVTRLKELIGHDPYNGSRETN